MLAPCTGQGFAATCRRTPAGRAAPRLAFALALALCLALPSPAAAQVLTTLSLSSSRPAAATNQPITFTATVAPAGPFSGVPTGEVTFYDGGLAVGRSALDGGVAAVPVRSLARGTHLITARYAGDGQFVATTGALAGGQVVADSAPVAGAGQAAGFDGLSQSARAEDPEGALDGVLTVELWFEAAPAAGAAPACLVQQGEGDLVRFGLCLSAARDRLVVRRGFETTFIPVEITPGWHRLALASGPVDTLVYLDGTVFTPLLGTLRGLTRQPLVIGGAPAGAGATDLFPGRIDELRLWSTVRTEAELEAWARQPVAGSAAGLAALWRMDEGAGGSLFDAGPAHLEALLASPGAASWSPSDAWRRRVIGAPRALAPFLAGYDADGDPFTATAAVAAGHGLVSFGAGGAAAYDPDTEYGGPDAFTVEVANGGGASRYQTVVEVPSPAACLVDATCSGGGSCVAGACVAPARLRTVGGSYGCATGGAPAGGPGAWAALAALALLALAPRRRRAAAALGLGVGLLLAALPARAAEGFAVRTVEPAPAGDRFLGVPDAGAAGHLVPSAAMGLGWTEKPLQLQLDGRPVAGGTLIERQLALHLGVSLSLWDRLLVDLSWPIDLIQLEQRPGAGAAPSGSALEDPRLGARVALSGGEALALAAGLTAWLPLGEAARFGSDGTLRLQPSLLASGRSGALVFASEAGLLIRRHKTALFTEVGPAATLRGALGWLVLGERLQVGPEVVARYQFSGATPLALDVLASARLAVAPGWSIAAALGTRHGAAAPGAPPLRALVQVAWQGEAPARKAVPPPSAPPAEPAVEPPPEPPEVAAPPALPAAPPEPSLAMPAPAPAQEPLQATAPPEPSPAAPEPVAVPPLPPAVRAVPAAPAARPHARPPPPAPPAPKPTGPLPPVTLTTTRIRIDQHITFDNDTARLQPASYAVLEAVARIMRANPRLSRVVVVGHTDVVGTREANLALSLKRAEAVRDDLVRRGVAAERLQVRGVGADQPVGDDATEAGREANRRVELIIATIGDR